MLHWNEDFGYQSHDPLFEIREVLFRYSVKGSCWSSAEAIEGDFFGKGNRV